MSNDLIPIIKATPSQLAKRKSAIKRRGSVSETDTLSDQQATLVNANLKENNSSNVKALQERQRQNKRAKPSFYRYTKDRELEQSDDIVYDDIEHFNVKVEPESHKGNKLDVLC